VHKKQQRPPQAARSTEDVFHFLEEGGIALGGAVLDFEGSAELREDFALLAGELGGREDGLRETR